MNEHVFYGILIPFLGTSLGAATITPAANPGSACFNWICSRSNGGCFYLEFVNSCY